MGLNMYTLFRDKPSRILGQALDPNIIYIRRTYKTLLEDVKSYYRKAPKHVASSNLFANIIQHFIIDFKLDDASWANKVEEQAKGLIRVFGLTSPINKGKIFTGGITLGPNTEEVAISSSDKFDKTNLAKRWRELTPVKYVYHTRTDTNIPIMNNTTPGKGYGVILVNIPMLLVQYRYWLKWQVDRGVEQLENSYRFVGSYVLPNMIDSYLDIAYFNRLDRQSRNIKNMSFPLAHPFYLTDLTPRVDRLIERVNFEALLKGIEIEGLAWITPAIVKNNLFEVMELPREPITYQNEWAHALARLPYIRYLLNMMKKNPGYDRSQLNEILIDLIEGSRDQIFVNMGDSDFVKTFRKQVAETIQELK